MKLFSDKLELTAIKSICSAKNELVQAKLLGSLQDSWFHYEPAKAAFARLAKVAKKRSEIMSWSELTEDPALDEEYRDVLRESEVAVCKDEERAQSLIEKLNIYRITRALYENAKATVEQLKAAKVDVDELLAKNIDRLSKLQMDDDLTEVVKVAGKNGNARNLMAQALSADHAMLYKTGFKDFDEKNGGLPSKGVVILAATTSGGKSTLVMNLLLQLYWLNKISVSVVSLEMGDYQITNRIGSRLTKIPFWKFKQKALSPKEKKKAIKAWKTKIDDFGEENDCKFGIIPPKRGVTIEKALMLTKPYGFNVIAIDYVGLLDGADSEKQAIALSNIVRYAKVYSEATNTLIILLAQLDKASGDIRYSRAMEEHADNVWAWSYYTEEQRQTGILNIEQRKARDQELFPFELKEYFEVMTVANMDEEIEIKGSSKNPPREKSFDQDSSSNLDEDAHIDYEKNG